MSYKILLICSFLIIRWGTVCAQMKPAIWLKAEDVHVGSPLWLDASGNNIKTTITENLEAGELINYNPSLSFENLNERILLDYNIKDLDHLTAFVVFRNDTIKGEKTIWGSTSKTDRKLLVSNLSLYDEFNQFEYSFGTTPRPLIAVVSKYWEKSVAPQKTHLFLGGDFASFDERFKGDFAEFILFDRPLSTTEYDVIQTYLSLKYGIGILQTDYINPKGEVIWNKEENAEYDRGVFGIGRYDSYGLYQKQAQNSYGFLSMAVKDFFETNQLNSGGMMRDSYVIASNNGSEPDYDTSVSDGQYGSKLLNKCKWKINASGAALSQTDLILKINRYDLFSDSISDVCMVIDKTVKGDYNQFVKVLPSSVDEEGNIYFKNIAWGSPGLKSAYFTFALSSEIDVELAYKTPLCDSEPVHVLGTIKGEGAPYRLKIYDKDDKMLTDQTISQQTFDVELESLGSYLVEIVDHKNNRVRRHSGNHLLSYRTERVLETDYWITSQPIEVTVNPAASLGITAYHWFYKNAWISDEHKLMADKEGDYTLIYTTTSGCQLEETFFVFDGRLPNDEDLPSSIENEIFADVAISVFPNPIRYRDFNIVFNLELPSDVHIEIYGTDGKFAHREKLAMVERYVYTGELKNPGVYLVVIKVNGEIFYRTKLIRL